MTSDEFKELSNWEKVRILTGMINPKTAVDTLAVVNLIARVELGMASEDFLNEVIDKIMSKNK